MTYRSAPFNPLALEIGQRIVWRWGSETWRGCAAGDHEGRVVEHRRRGEKPWTGEDAVVVEVCAAEMTRHGASHFLLERGQAFERFEAGPAAVRPGHDR